MKRTGIILALIATLPAAAWGKEPPREPVAQPSAISDCSERPITIYFGHNTSDLSPYAEQAIASAVEKLRGCEIHTLKATVTSSDATGPNEALSLSKARADAVLASLAGHGIFPTNIAQTMATPIHTQRQGISYERPMARRVDISFETVRAINS